MQQNGRMRFMFCAPGHANASFCPHAYGCRNVLVSENQIILDVTDHEIFLTVQIPDQKTLWLVRFPAQTVVFFRKIRDFTPPCLIRTTCWSFLSPATAPAT